MSHRSDISTMFADDSMNSPVHPIDAALRALATAVITQAVKDYRSDNRFRHEEAQSALSNLHNASIRLWCDVLGLDQEVLYDSIQRACQGKP